MTILQPLGASIAMKIVDCCGVYDPATASLYMMLYQVIINSLSYHGHSVYVGMCVTCSTVPEL